MININCNDCKNHCCGSNPHLTPVLLPSEEERFKENSQIVETPFREMRTLGKKENGNCIFLDDKTTKCTIYNERPLECRLYPFLLDFSFGKPNTKLDKRFCPNLNTLYFDKDEISALIKKEQFPKDWIKAYGVLEDY
ncbi:MAG: YkgJ family cysteine cluster protein [Patescibacteria group bacterium]|nr:YkgJ family cysteine cluster protein [Patescibacteria group bacterium]